MRLVPPHTKPRTTRQTLTCAASCPPRCALWPAAARALAFAARCGGTGPWPGGPGGGSSHCQHSTAYRILVSFYDIHGLTVLVGVPITASIPSLLQYRTGQHCGGTHPRTRGPIGGSSQCHNSIAQHHACHMSALEIPTQNTELDVHKPAATLQRVNSSRWSGAFPLICSW